jgi:hypothetical protein
MKFASVRVQGGPEIKADGGHPHSAEVGRTLRHLESLDSRTGDIPPQREREQNGTRTNQRSAFTGIDGSSTRHKSPPPTRARRHQYFPGRQETSFQHCGNVDKMAPCGVDPSK